MAKKQNENLGVKVRNLQGQVEELQRRLEEHEKAVDGKFIRLVNKLEARTGGRGLFTTIEKEL